MLIICTHERNKEHRKETLLPHTVPVGSLYQFLKQEVESINRWDLVIRSKGFDKSSLQFWSSSEHNHRQTSGKSGLMMEGLLSVTLNPKSPSDGGGEDWQSLASSLVFIVFFMTFYYQLSLLVVVCSDSWSCGGNMYLLILEYFLFWSTCYWSQLM